MGVALISSAPNDAWHSSGIKQNVGAGAGKLKAQSSKLKVQDKFNFETPICPANRWWCGAGLSGLELPLSFELCALNFPCLRFASTYPTRLGLLAVGCNSCRQPAWTAILRCGLTGITL
jgi:hypothetical protein